MLREIIGAHVKEVMTRIQHRQDPECIAEDFLKRRIITHGNYNEALNAIREAYKEYEEAGIKQ